MHRATLIAAAATAAALASPALADGHSPAPVFTPSERPAPFSEAVQVGDVLYLSGQLGVDPATRTLVPGGIAPETRAMMAGIGATLAKHGLDWSSVFKCTVFLADIADWPAFNAIYVTYFEQGRYPARSALGANGLALGAAVEMECLAHRPQR